MNDDQFTLVRRDMHRRFGLMFAPETIDRVLDEIIDEHVSGARISTFMAVMVEREASERFEEMASEQQLETRRRKELLFVCRRNAGRSQLASAITRHLVGNEVLHRSVGLEPSHGIDETVLEVLRERGISTDGLYQKTIVPRTVHTSDVVVLMGVDGVPGVPGHRYVTWDVADPEGQPIDKVREIADDVERRVRELLDELEVFQASA
ncbi:Arsenate-mycothiol transferase ArsC2 [Corynebacterium occultum]|uniref:Arsenate-mycothiol transferase ArsC2 n=1 Tax=Corynebacterium occultum TaxID=2675219 RepID=A0A6B8WCE3_9CORY|nr:low molecular weight phosphatase family protein [Corynebacterium occultum]QGU08546.1 Arsenate-mycothiol transferase ArsC2 [Corynebacterium occultum]